MVNVWTGEAGNVGNWTSEIIQKDVAGAMVTADVGKLYLNAEVGLEVTIAPQYPIAYAEEWGDMAKPRVVFATEAGYTLLQDPTEQTWYIIAGVAPLATRMLIWHLGGGTFELLIIENGVTIVWPLPAEIPGISSYVAAASRSCSHILATSYNITTMSYDHYLLEVGVGATPLTTPNYEGSSHGGVAVDNYPSIDPIAAVFVVLNQTTGVNEIVLYNGGSFSYFPCASVDEYFVCASSDGLYAVVHNWVTQTCKYLNTVTGLWTALPVISLVNYGSPVFCRNTHRLLSTYSTPESGSVVALYDIDTDTIIDISAYYAGMNGAIYGTFSHNAEELYYMTSWGGMFAQTYNAASGLHIYPSTGDPEQYMYEIWDMRTAL